MPSRRSIPSLKKHPNSLYFSKERLKRIPNLRVRKRFMILSIPSLPHIRSTLLRSYPASCQPSRKRKRVKRRWRSKGKLLAERWWIRPRWLVPLEKRGMPFAGRALGGWLQVVALVIGRLGFRASRLTWRRQGYTFPSPCFVISPVDWCRGVMIGVLAFAWFLVENFGLWLELDYLSVGKLLLCERDACVVAILRIPIGGIAGMSSSRRLGLCLFLNLATLPIFICFWTAFWVCLWKKSVLSLGELVQWLNHLISHWNFIFFPIRSCNKLEGVRLLR